MKKTLETKKRIILIIKKVDLNAFISLSGKIFEKINFFSLFIILGVFIYLNLAIYSQHRDEFIIRFLDVGQGDSILITTPQKRQILIDTGKPKTSSVLLSEYLPLYKKEIDYLILTHMDSDHTGDAMNILRRYKVNNLVLNPSYEDVTQYNEILQTAYRNGTKTKLALSDDSIEIDGVKILVLYPLIENLEEQLKDNDLSISVKVTYNKFDIILTGDLAINGETKILEEWQGLEAEVLKLGHHGSKYSSSDDFLDLVNPQIAVVSAGAKNSYGHPDSDLIKRIEKQNRKIFDTRFNGTISLYSKDGVSFYKR